MRLRGRDGPRVEIEVEGGRNQYRERRMFDDAFFVSSVSKLPWLLIDVHEDAIFERVGRG